MACPLAQWTHPKGTNEKESFSFKVVPFGNSYGKCFSCGWTGNSFSLARDYRKYSGIDLMPLVEDLEESDYGAMASAMEWEEVEEVPKFKPESYLDKFEPLPPEKWPRFSEDVQKKWGLMYDSKENAVVLPVRNKEGLLMGCQGRRLGNHPKGRYYNYDRFSKGRNLFGIHLDFSPAVVLVEGPTDAMKVNALTGLHTVAMFGNKLSVTQAKLLQALYDEVYLFPDNDTAGQKHLAYHCSVLSEKTVHLVSYQGLAYKDPGDLPDDLLQKFLDEAKEINFINKVTTKEN